VSGVSLGRSKRAQQTPLHFVSYDMMFKYHSSVLNGGLAQNAFVSSKNDLNIVLRGCDTEVSRQVFRQAYEIVIHSLQYDAKQAWSCDECPKE
jgi:hypothetical protein